MLRRRAFVPALFSIAACASVAGIDGLTIDDGKNPTQPADGRDSGGDEDHILDPGDGGVIDPSNCVQPTNDRFGVLDPKWIMRGVASHGVAGIQLTPETVSAVGQLYWDEALTFDRFEVTFKFKIETTDASTPGDGIAFAWLDGEQMPALADGGGHHGIYTKKGFAVVIDTYKNAEDPVVPDVSVRTSETLVRITASAALPALIDGSEHEAKVRLIGKDLTVTVDGRQAFATTLASYVPYVGHASFSAGTGSAKSSHTVTEVTLRIGSNGACAAP
jgi:hypothetical protein